MATKRKFKRFRSLRNRLLIRAALRLERQMGGLSLERIQGLGGRLGRLVAAFPSKRQRRVMEHLEIAFPERDRAWRQETARQSFESVGRNVLESLWVAGGGAESTAGMVMNPPGRMEALIARAREEKRGLICFSAHLGAWEVCNFWFGRMVDLPVMVIAGKPKEGELQDALRARRELSGARMVYRGEAGLPAIRHLKAGGILLMLVDHNLRGDGVGVPFFGRAAHTLLAPARLALQSGALATTIFAMRREPGRFVLEVEEAIDLPPYARDREERFRQEASLAREYTARIEAAIRRDPGQYLWMHRRWYHRKDTLPFPS